MLTIGTSLQTDNHTNTSSLNFYRPDALPDQPTNGVKARKAYKNTNKNTNEIQIKNNTKVLCNTNDNETIT